MDRWPRGAAGGSSAGRGGGGGGGGGSGRADPKQLLGIAERMLGARDLVGCRKFAECAMESDPLIEGADRILAAADVLLAAQQRRINNHVDWYAVLQLDVPATGGGRDLHDVRFQYRRLSLLLRPGGGAGGGQPSPSCSPADEAFKFVSDAWAVLSNPTKKELYDKELAIAAAARLSPNGGGVGAPDSREDPWVRASREPEVGGVGSFWTACLNCFYLHEYERGYEGRALLCRNCRKVFLATEMASPPPIVPGSDMYYCAWGLFPLGFPGGPNFGWPSNVANEPEVWRDAAGKPSSQASFEGLHWSWGGQGPAAAGGWVNAEHGNGDSDVRFGSAGKKPMESNVGLRENQSLSAAKAHGATTSETAPKEMRKKVMAKRPRRQVAGAVERGVAAPGKEEMVVDQANKVNTDVGDAGKPDGGNNERDVGCARTVEISAEDVDLNFSMDIGATEDILNSLSTLPFLKDGEVVVVD